MRSLSDTTRRLAALRHAAATPHDPAAAGRLIELTGFGTNPGALRAYTHRPATAPDAAALVVVLHGCTQTAAGYDIGAGWSDMADRHGFALLFAEQRRENNAQLCFNWFAPADSRRGSGEALSIREMIDTVVARGGIDPARIFVTGLSAGGAMAAVMLATYPELFAGGAIIAGLPFGAARTVPEAFDRMRGHGLPDGRTLAARVRDASGHGGAWPTLSVWHGDDDATVSPVNADALIGQWCALHGVAPAAAQPESVDGARRRTWRDAGGRPVIEDTRIAGIGHGTPLDTCGEGGCGRSGAYMIEAAISSTAHICRFWGLAEATAAPRSDPDLARPGRAAGAAADRREGAPRRADAAPRPAAGVARVIEEALRAAGLMR